MGRRFDSDSLVIASHNPGKVAEIRDLMAPLKVDVESAADLGLMEPEETGATFVENAEIKARAAAAATGRAALADDSGLAVVALDGEPGIHSARWAGPDKDFQGAMEKVEKALHVKKSQGTSEDRRASFVCALALCWPDGHCETVEGVVHGHLVWPPRGNRGFGYDPIFVAEGRDITFGETEPAEKHAISHRADAFRKLLAACFKE